MPENPSEELRKSIDDFLSAFNFSLYRGQAVEFVYTPEKGFYVMVDGQIKGKVSEGNELAQLVWTNYFTEDTCCKNLKNGILICVTSNLATQIDDIEPAEI